MISTGFSSYHIKFTNGKVILKTVIYLSNTVLQLFLFQNVILHPPTYHIVSIILYIQIMVTSVNRYHAHQ